jgi:hypothetical protein
MFGVNAPWTAFSAVLGKRPYESAESEELVALGAARRVLTRYERHPSPSSAAPAARGDGIFCLVNYLSGGIAILGTRGNPLIAIDRDGRERFRIEEGKSRFIENLAATLVRVPGEPGPR